MSALAENFYEVPAGAVELGECLAEDGEGEHIVENWTELPSGAVVLSVKVMASNGERVRRYDLNRRPGTMVAVRA